MKNPIDTLSPEIRVALRKAAAAEVEMIDRLDLSPEATDLAHHEAFMLLCDAQSRCEAATEAAFAQVPPQFLDAALTFVSDLAEDIIERRIPRLIAGIRVQKQMKRQRLYEEARRERMKAKGKPELHIVA